MSLLKDAIQKKKYDVRMIDQNLNRGVVKSSEVDQNISSLEDVSENVEWVNLEELADDSSQAQGAASSLESSTVVNGSVTDSSEENQPV